jgi:hypothetical protein
LQLKLTENSLKLYRVEVLLPSIRVMFQVFDFFKSIHINHIV